MQGFKVPLALCDANVSTPKQLSYLPRHDKAAVKRCARGTCPVPDDRRDVRKTDEGSVFCRCVVVGGHSAN